VTVLVTLTIGLILWIVAWSFDIKAFDAFMVTVLMVVSAAAYTIAKPFIDQMLGRGAEPRDDKGGIY
jgi:multisubunit Na+/H+ antiporter MnhG subunit